MATPETPLTTIEGRTPGERRRSIVEQVKAVVDADFGAYLDLTPVADGVFHYDQVACTGSQDVTANWLTAVGTPSIAIWDPCEPPPGEGNRFRPGADIDARELAGIPIYDRHYIPFGLCRERRMLVYHGGVFAGWIGVSRHLDAPGFTRAEEERLQRAAPRIIGLVRDCFDDTDCYAGLSCDFDSARCVEP